MVFFYVGMKRFILNKCMHIQTKDDFLGSDNHSVLVLSWIVFKKFCSFY